MLSILKTVACFVQLLVLTCTLNAQTGSVSPGDTITPRGYVCPRTAQSVKVDGRLDDQAWQSAPWTDNFADIEGGIRPLPRYRTRVKMLWDEKYFYFGAELEEPHVWATLTKRDTVIFYDNDFEIFIDPNGDNHEYYEFEMNALNTVWDLFLVKPYKDGGAAVDSWNIEGLKTAVHVDGTINDPRDLDKGWSAEIAMPWSALKEYAHMKVPPSEGDKWRVNFSRVEWQHEISGGRYAKVKGKREDNWVWSPQGVVDMHRPEMWGYVEFTAGGSGKKVYSPDSSLHARKMLIQIYYAQVKFHDKLKRWASTPEELELRVPQGDGDIAGSPLIRLTDEWYVATVSLRLKGGKTMKWNIRQDSRIWADR